MRDPGTRRRGWFTGVWNIVRFNPGFFLAGTLVVLCGWILIALLADRLPVFLAATAWVGVASASWWLLTSLLASWWIYDLSPLYRWNWLEVRAAKCKERVVFGHAGFDEVTLSLRERFPDSEVVPVDFHDPVRMTERSIRRARRLCPPLPGTLPVGLEPWPLREESLIVFPLSAHEWRRPEERRQLLNSASRSLAPDGCIIVVEHLRDLRNFLVFGPGFLHFHSESTWIGDAAAAGLSVAGRFRVAFFLRGMVLKHSAPREIP